MTARRTIGVGMVAAAAIFGFVRIGGAGENRQRLGSIPATLTLSAEARPGANPGDGMLSALTALGPRYGFTVSPDRPTPREPEWSVLIQCRHEVVALVHSNGEGRFFTGTLLIYGFKDRRDYALFKDELVRLFEQYGKIHEVENGEILSDGELALRAKRFGADFASRCSPPAVGVPGDGAR